ncbi:hypothetical protein Y1Q_0003150 [Alligator mississippiensis]|uniref:Uncharacterized protein n=1 Tax=Alligator mississippiensis TaxID=8496 RepID=A0A151MDM8_ALLMI|nr:hypothetical protein Y1Q_0003150 [Alligator mississippiensis]
MKEAGSHLVTVLFTVLSTRTPCLTGLHTDYHRKNSEVPIMCEILHLQKPEKIKELCRVLRKSQLQQYCKVREDPTKFDV